MKVSADHFYDQCTNGLWHEKTLPAKADSMDSSGSVESWLQYKHSISVPEINRVFLLFLFAENLIIKRAW